MLNHILTQRTRDVLRQVLNLILSLTQWAATYFASVTGIGMGIEARAAGGETLIEPIFYAFFIWFLIYFACVAYGVYQALPSQRENPLLRRIGFFTASAFLANTVYAVVAQVWGNDWILVAIFLWTLTSLFKAFFQFSQYRNRFTTAESYLVVLPISIFTGWVTLVIIVNAASALKTSGFGNFGLSEGNWAILLLLAAGLIGSYLTLASRGNVWYSLTFIWGLIGIMIVNLTRNLNTEVAVTAVSMAVLIALILLRARGGGHSKAPV
jgi:hypothetical protein